MNSRKIISSLFILLLVICLSTTVFAANNNAIAFTVESSDSTVSAGSTFTLDLNLSQNTGFVSAKVSVVYDPAQITYVEFSEEDSALPISSSGSAATLFVADTKSSGKRAVNVTVGSMMAALSPATGELYTQTGKVVTLKFKVADNYEGALDITLTYSQNNITNKAGDKDYVVTVKNPSVTSVSSGTHIHTEVTIPGKDATCTATGLTDGKKCSVCGEILVKQEVIPVKPHTEVTVTGYAATCTKTGLTDGKKCSVCGEVTVKQETIPMVAHTEKTLPGKAATCTDAGMTDGKQCSVCGTITVKQEPINAKGHNLKEDTSKYVAPTCTTAGKKVSVCANGCGHSVETSVAATGHNMKEDATKYVAPTCTTAGKKISVCANGCGHTAETTVDALGHKAITIPGKAATCTESGLTEGSKCELCGEVLKVQQTIGKIAHSTQEIPAVPATCTDAGKTKGEKCSVCGVILKAQETVPAKGHSVSNALVNSDANGHYKVCTRGCGYTESYAKHNLVNGVCSDCGYGCNHTGGTATCSKKAVCTICGNEYGELLAHTPGKEADCLNAQTCTVCGEVLKDALGHTLTYTDAQAPTCSAVGWEAYEACKNCDHTTYKEIAATGEHVYENDCDATCNTCGAERTTKGHSFGAWETVKEATESAEGEKKHTCSICGYSETEKIPMIEKEETDSSIIWIIVLAVLVVAAVAVIVILIVRKKK